MNVDFICQAEAAGRAELAVRAAISSVFKPTFNGSSMDNDTMTTSSSQWYNDLPSHSSSSDVPSRQQSDAANAATGSDTSLHLAQVPSSSTRQLARFDSNEAVAQYLSAATNRSP